MGSLSMDGAYHPWMAGLLVVENPSTRRMAGHHGKAYHPWKCLPSTDGRRLSMDGRIHEWDATPAADAPSAKEVNHGLEFNTKAV